MATVETPKPSVGRIVHYQSHGSPNGQHKSEPRAAVITGTYGDGPVQPAGNPPIVDLCVLNPSGIFFDRGVGYDADGRPGTWRWPPRT